MTLTLTVTRLTRRTAAVLCAAALGTTAVKIRAADATVTEREVTVATSDGAADAVLFYPGAGRGPWAAVILWHDQSGLRPVYREMGRRLAARGFVVLTPNAFYRSGHATGHELDSRTPEGRKQLAALRAAATDDGVARDGAAYVSYLDTLKQAKKGGTIGTVGYDLGGSYAFRIAAAVPDRIVAVASIHGLGVATTRPNSPHLLVPKTKASYFVVQSTDDDAREPEDKDEYKRVLDEGHLQGTVEVYPANHGFAVPGNPAYNKDSAERAWRGMVALLTARLK